MYPMWIWMHQTKRWELHVSSNHEIRMYLRGVWRSAGHCVELIEPKDLTVKEWVAL